MPSRRKMRRKGYRHIARREMIAIVFDFDNGRLIPRRYHTQEISRILEKFEMFVRQTFPNARYINYYKQKRYYYRKYLIVQDSVNCLTAMKKQRSQPVFRDLRDPVMRFVQEYSLY